MTRATTAFEESRSSLRHLENTKPTYILAKKNRKILRDICQKYWTEKATHARISLVDVKPDAARIVASIHALIDTVKTAAPAVHTAADFLSSEPVYFGETLRNLRGWANIYDTIANTEGDPGRRNADYLDNALGRLAVWWETLAGRQFPKTVSLLYPGSEEFLSPGPEFALRMIKAVDPSVTFAQVRTALKKDGWRNQYNYRRVNQPIPGLRDYRIS